VSGQELAKLTPMQQVCETIASREFGQKLAQALPANVSLDRFRRVTLTAIQQNPELITADRGSLYNSVIRCAQDGLQPDGREAALVIFKTKGVLKAQYLPMVGGLRKVLAQHGYALTAQVVHEYDTFDYQLGDDPWLKHKPPKLGKPRGEIVGAYALVKDTQGRLIIEPEVMSRAEIEEVRRVSRAATSEYGPWVNWYAEMCRKTVARRAFKQVPLGDLDENVTELLRAADADVDFGEPDRMSLEEANLSASLAPGALMHEDGPVDVIEGEAQEALPVDEPESFEARAERAMRERAARETE